MKKWWRHTENFPTIGLDDDYDSIIPTYYFYTAYLFNVIVDLRQTPHHVKI